MDAAAVGDGDDPVDGLVDRGDPAVLQYRLRVDRRQLEFILTGPSSTQPCECSSSPVRRGPSHADVTQIFPSRHTHAICPCGVAAKKFTTGTGDHVFDDLAKRTGLASISVDPNFKIGAKSKKGTSLACLPSVRHNQYNYACLPSVRHDQCNYACLPSVTHDQYNSACLPSVTHDQYNYTCRVSPL